MRTVLSKSALARTKILHALVRCRRVGRSAPLFSFTQRMCGRATGPFFLIAVHRVGRSDLPPHALPHPDDPKV